LTIKTLPDATDILFSLTSLDIEYASVRADVKKINHGGLRDEILISKKVLETYEIPGSLSKLLTIKINIKEEDSKD